MQNVALLNPFPSPGITKLSLTLSLPSLLNVRFMKSEGIVVTSLLVMMNHNS